MAGWACRAGTFPLCRDGGDERRKSGAKTRRAVIGTATDVASDRPFEINRTAILVRDCERVFQIQYTIWQRHGRRKPTVIRGAGKGLPAGCGIRVRAQCCVEKMGYFFKLNARGASHWRGPLGSDRLDAMN